VGHNWTFLVTRLHCRPGTRKGGRDWKSAAAEQALHEACQIAGAMTNAALNRINFEALDRRRDLGLEQ
jgi:hypothetical protein